MGALVALASAVATTRPTKQLGRVVDEARGVVGAAELLILVQADQKTQVGADAADAKFTQRAQYALRDFLGLEVELDVVFLANLRELLLVLQRALLEFFLARLTPNLFLHFEMIPDRLPEGLRDIIAKFPAGALQFEVGIQTFDPEIAARIDRAITSAQVARSWAV